MLIFDNSNSICLYVKSNLKYSILMIVYCRPIHTAVLNGDLGILRRQCFALKVRKISVDILNNQGQVNTFCFKL